MVTQLCDLQLRFSDPNLSWRIKWQTYMYPLNWLGYTIDQKKVLISYWDWPHCLCSAKLPMTRITLINDPDRHRIEKIILVPHDCEVTYQVSGQSDNNSKWDFTEILAFYNFFFTFFLCFFLGPILKFWNSRTNIVVFKLFTLTSIYTMYITNQ